MSQIQSRKSDHLDLTARGEVGFRDKTTLFECVELVHDALPESSLERVDLSCLVLGKRLQAPLLIAGMTGGTERAQRINRGLARVAEEEGFAFGLGSQRPILRLPETVESYRVREVAPNVLLLGNIGAVQATELGVSGVAALAEAVSADAMCLHLNAAMEIVQPEGDREFGGCEPLFGELVRSLPVPVIAKETGCGLSRSVGQRLRQMGVEHVDVSGAGGTSWVAVETLRTSTDERSLGELLWDWGIPTAASVLAMAPLGFQTVFATGGMKNGLEAAKALALGASVVGIARPVLQAYERGLEAGGEGAASQAARAYLQQVVRELRSVMLLVGARQVRELRRVPRLVGGRLREWGELWNQ